MDDAKGGRLLLVEPDKEQANELLGMFARADYEVELGGNLAEAVELIKNVQFDCAIIDVDLPETKGYEAARIIKAIAPQLPIIITAQSNSREQESKVRDQDIVYYYLKSFDRSELKLAVDGVVRNGQGRKETDVKGGEK